MHMNSVMPMKSELRLSVQHAVRGVGAPLRAQISRAVRIAQERDAEVTVRIVGEAEGLTLNQTFRHQHHATNVLSFPYAQIPVVQGDLVLCAPVVAREAQEQGKELLAHYMHLIVHGMLHLQGYDHENEIDARIMEQREIVLVARLGFANPYGTTDLFPHGRDGGLAG